MTVPLPTNILAEDIREIINEAECAALVVSLREVPALAPLVASCPTVRSVIIMDRCRTVTAAPRKHMSSSYCCKSCTSILLFLLCDSSTTPPHTFPKTKVLPSAVEKGWAVLTVA